MESMTAFELAPLPTFVMEVQTPPNPNGHKTEPFGDKIRKGEQHSTLVSLAGTMRQRGMNAEEIEAALLVTNAQRLEEPAPPEHIRRIAQSVCNLYDAGEMNPPMLASNKQPADWEPPTPFFQADVPDFPTDAYPLWLRSFVEAEAIATQTPLDLAGMLALSGLSTALAKKVVVRVRDGWQEPVNVYTVTALLPGNRKSAVFVDVAGPIEEHERAEAERLAPEIAEAENRHKVAKGQLEHVQAQAAKAKPEERATLTAEAADLAREQATISVPAIPRLIVDDITPEKLSTLLRDQGGRLAVLSAEGDIFDLMAGRYSEKGANFGVFLRGHAGDNLRVDRVGRPPEFVRAPALTMGLAVQPEVIRGLVKQPGFRGRGLLARFLYSWPKSTVGQRDVDAPPVPEAIRAAYHTGILDVLALPFGTDDHGKPAPHVLRLDAEAGRLLLDFMRWLEPQLGEFGELATMQDWGAKLAGAVVRIAGLLHIAEHRSDPTPWQYPIRAATIKEAIRLGHYLIAHARLAFAEMGADEELEDAKHVLRWLQRAGVASFTKRDAYNGTRRYFKRVEAMEPALKLLESHAFIRERQTEERHGPGRKPSPSYEVNPHLLGNSAYCADSAYAASVLRFVGTGRDSHSEAYIQSSDDGISTVAPCTHNPHNPHNSNEPAEVPACIDCHGPLPPERPVGRCDCCTDKAYAEYEQRRATGEFVEVTP